MGRPAVLIIGMGGTIHSITDDSLNLGDYIANGRMVSTSELVAMFPEVSRLADPLTMDFRSTPSPDLGFTDWKRLVQIIDEYTQIDSSISGVVVTHGTATLEETAYFLSLTAKTHLPIVVTGAQRPPSTLSSDAGMNLLGAVRTAISPHARGQGVLVVMNDEIHAARDVTKSTTHRIHAFRSGSYGPLGHVEADEVVIHRRGTRRVFPDTEFDVRALTTLPRVDIVYSYAGCDATAINAFIRAGARGIVSAGFAPGVVGAAQEEALRAAIASRPVLVVQSSRAGSGRVSIAPSRLSSGILSADDLTPQKARILLALALSVEATTEDVRRIFSTY